MKETICAVVVTFNRKLYLEKCLQSLITQNEKPNAIVLIDNASTDGTDQLLMELGFLSELPPNNTFEPYECTFKINDIIFIYKKMNVNTGGSGGFHEGVKKAHTLGYNWIWLMDDDVTCEPNAIEVLKKYQSFSKCIHPSRKFEDGEIFNWYGYINESNGQFVSRKDEFSSMRRFSSVNFGCFEGMCIASEIVDLIGYPDQKYFFNGDDTIYGFMASKHTSVIYIEDVLMTRLIDKRKTKPSILADYLYARNITEIMNKIAKNRINSNFTRFKEITRLFLSRVLKKQLHKNALWIIIGYFDGLTNNFGREKRFLN